MMPPDADLSPGSRNTTPPPSARPPSHRPWTATLSTSSDLPPSSPPGLSSASPHPYRVPSTYGPDLYQLCRSAPQRHRALGGPAMTPATATNCQRRTSSREIDGLQAWIAIVLGRRFRSDSLPFRPPDVADRRSQEVEAAPDPFAQAPAPVNIVLDREAGRAM